MSGKPGRVLSFGGWWWLMLPIVASAWVRDLWAPDEPRYADLDRDGKQILVVGASVTIDN